MLKAEAKYKNQIFNDNFDSPELRGILKQSRKDLRVVELFAGAGGMGLGFLMASNSEYGYKIIHSAEIDRIYLNSLEKNYKYYENNFKNRLDNCIPSDFTPCDLTENISRYKLQEKAQKAGGVDIVIGGTPCQGFSTSNRGGWNAKKHHNKLVEYFIELALELSPKVILLENVQGILWTSRSNRKTKKKLSVVDHFAKKLKKAGYLLFPTLLDAAWYGVPQHRNRFFLLAIHQDLGYAKEYFGEWGAFPQPTHGKDGTSDYVTVEEAISDLPKIKNGEKNNFQKYCKVQEQNSFLAKMRQMSDGNIIEGHIVSNQADYVIERYKNIPPGGNWQNIRHMMTNYKDIEKTHSNIYRRLEWDKPSITIGNYRKSMIVHPEQDRGLSLREATRLQSFPDWFTFCGHEDISNPSGITHKQQQLANAVSFLMTLSVAKYILEL